jgi:hypothetical protein
MSPSSVPQNLCPMLDRGFGERSINYRHVRIKFAFLVSVAILQPPRHVLSWWPSIELHRFSRMLQTKLTFYFQRSTSNFCRPLNKYNIWNSSNHLRLSCIQAITFSALQPENCMEYKMTFRFQNNV